MESPVFQDWNASSLRWSWRIACALTTSPKQSSHLEPPAKTAKTAVTHKNVPRTCQCEREPGLKLRRQCSGCGFSGDLQTMGASLGSVLVLFGFSSRLKSTHVCTMKPLQHSCSLFVTRYRPFSSCHYPCETHGRHYAPPHTETQPRFLHSPLGGCPCASL